MLDDVVVHVHQDPDTRDTWKVKLHAQSARLQIGPELKYNLLAHSPFFTFLVHFGHPLCGHAVLLWYLRRTDDSSLKRVLCWKQIALPDSILLSCDQKKASLTASIRPLSVGDFSIRASNTSSASFLTYNSTAERGGRIKLHAWAAVFSLVFIYYLLVSGEISSTSNLIKNGNSFCFQRLNCKVLLCYMKYLLFLLFIFFFRQTKALCRRHLGVVLRFSKTKNSSVNHRNSLTFHSR